jgi:hypothetical protein
VLAKAEDDPRMLDVTSFSHEAWFHVTGYMNSQNTCRIWSTVPTQPMKIPLTPLRLECGVHCLGHRIVGPILFENTNNSERYIVRDFLGHLAVLNTKKGVFECRTYVCMCLPIASASTVGSTYFIHMQYFRVYPS